MNANEIADELERPVLEKPNFLHFGVSKERMEKVITMLRQQQAEIEALKTYVCEYRDEYVPFINWAANRKAQEK